MYKLFHKFFGYYSVFISGENAINLINKMQKEKLLFWGLETADNGYTIKFSLFSHPFAALYAGDLNVDFEIIKCIGVPFIVYKYKKRLGLLAGTILGLFLIYLSSLYVWEININGIDTLEEEDIIAVLRDNGLSLGTYIPNLAIKKTELLFLINMPDVSSASINVKGTYVNIDIIEQDRAPEIIDVAGYYNVIADYDGIIYSVEALSGIPQVKAGDVVTKGQILISGEYLGKYDTLIQTHARGIINAKVYRQYSVTIPLSFDYKQYTGRTDTKTVYTVLGQDFNMFFGTLIPFDFFDAEITTDILSPFGFIKIPVIKTTLVTREYVRSQMPLTVQEAEIKAIAAFNDWCELELDGPILFTEYELTYNDVSKCVVLKGFAEIVTDIAREVAFTPSGEKLESENRG